MITEPESRLMIYEGAFKCSLATKYDYGVLATFTSTLQTTTSEISLALTRVDTVDCSTSLLEIRRTRVGSSIEGSEMELKKFYILLFKNKKKIRTVLSMFR